MKYISADKLLEAIEQSRQDNPYTDRARREAYDRDHDHFFTMVAMMPGEDVMPAAQDRTDREVR